MLKRDELTNPNSCLNRAADDEPIFVLRANDPLAAQIVRQWAELYMHNKSYNRAMTQKELNKYNDAIRNAQNMENWHRLEKRLNRADPTGVRS